MPGRRLLVGLALALVVAVPGPAAGDDGEDRLRVLGHPDHEQHDEALAWWEAQNVAEQVAILRRALASKDGALSTLAAEALGAEYLTNDEIRAQMRLLIAKDPMSVRTSPDTRRAWGIGEGIEAHGRRDLVPCYQQIVARKLPHGRERLDPWHRVMHPHQVQELVPLLETASRKTFPSVLWLVTMCAEYDREDEHRETVARGLLYALKRLRAERGGRPLPRLDPAPIDLRGPIGDGLPQAFLTLMPAFYPRNGDEPFWLGDYGQPEDELPLRSTYLWLRRWMLTLTPSAEDLPFLRHFIEVAESHDTRLLRWAVGHMANFPGADGIERVRGWAQGTDHKAAYASAVLAERGAPKRFDALFDAMLASMEKQHARRRELMKRLLWSVDRARARERWVIDVLGQTFPPRPETKLDVPARVGIWRFGGIEITDEDMAWIAKALTDRKAAPLTLAWFYGTVWPEGITDERLRALLPLLRDLPADAWAHGGVHDVLHFLAMVEVRDPASLASLLHGWIETQKPIRREVLVLLARLGDTKFAADMLKDWPQWEEGQRVLLGRVKTDAVRAFLVQRSESAEPEQAVPAILARLHAAGLPYAEVEQVLYAWMDDLDAKPLPAIRRCLGRGDDLGAVIEAVRDTAPHLLGLLDDLRAREHLVERRAARHEGEYLAATIGLAIAGDVDALREVRAFLEDDRLVMIENLPDDIWSYLPGPWIDEHWVSRLDTNCCLGFRGMVALRARYPTIPFEDGYGGAGTRRTRAWIQSQRFKHSKILDGQVPAGR